MHAFRSTQRHSPFGCIRETNTDCSDSTVLSCYDPHRASWEKEKSYFTYEYHSPKATDNLGVPWPTLWIPVSLEAMCPCLFVFSRRFLDAFRQNCLEIAIEAHPPVYPLVIERVNHIFGARRRRYSRWRSFYWPAWVAFWISSFFCISRTHCRSPPTPRSVLWA